MLDKNKNVMELTDNDDDLPDTQEVNIGVDEDSAALMGEGDELEGDENIDDDFDMEDDLSDISDDDLFDL